MTYGLRDVDGQIVEVCDQCGFDARYVRDVRSAMDCAFEGMQSLQERPRAAERPAPEVWSATEYAGHVVEGTNTVGALVCTALQRPAPEVAMDVASARAAAVALAGSVSDADCLIPCPLDDAPTDVGRALLHLLHDLEHHVLDVRQGLAALVIAASPAVYPADAHAIAPAV